MWFNWSSVDPFDYRSTLNSNNEQYANVLATISINSAKFVWKLFRFVWELMSSSFSRVVWSSKWNDMINWRSYFHFLWYVDCIRYIHTGPFFAFNHRWKIVAFSFITLFKAIVKAQLSANLDWTQCDESETSNRKVYEIWCTRMFEECNDGWYFSVTHCFRSPILSAKMPSNELVLNFNWFADIDINVLYVLNSKRW